MMVSGSVYRIATLGLVIGHTISPVPDGGRRALISRPKTVGSWRLAPGLYTPRQVVEAVTPLLDTVVQRLGRDPPGAVPAREMLLDNLASNLAMGTREATLSFRNASDQAKKEIASQITKIGKTLVQYAREVKHEEVDPNIRIRSPCEGHLWTHSVAALLFGPRSESHLLQLFNEYLHQIVILRDSLIPFYNYSEVLIPIESHSPGSGGMRDYESARSQFLTELLTRRLSQASVFKLAKSLLAPKLPSETGYGFQYANGMVLPSFLAGHSTLHLLDYYPAKLVDSTSEVLLQYEYPDYFSAPRTEMGAAVDKLTAGVWPPASLGAQTSRVTHCSLGLAKHSKADDPGKQLLKLQLQFGEGQCVSVDVGQIARGWRYAYRVQEATNGNVAGTSETQQGFTENSLIYNPLSVLTDSGSGLVYSSEKIIRVIPIDDARVGLALLGKIYPENVILLKKEQPAQAVEAIGKSLSSKFVIWGWDSVV